MIGIGNRWRSDDAAGLAVAAALRGGLPASVVVLEREGDPTGLLDAWDGAGAVWVVDAVSSGAPAGTVHRVDAAGEPLPAGLFTASTHHFGLAEAVELARTLGRLPARTVLYGIEGERFAAGEGLSAAVAAAVPDVARRVRSELGRLQIDRFGGVP